MFDGLLRPASKVFTGTPHVFSEVLAASKYAAMPDVSTHASARSAHLGAAFFHLPGGGVVILLSDAIQRRQG